MRLESRLQAVRLGFRLKRTDLKLSCSESTLSAIPARRPCFRMGPIVILIERKQVCVDGGKPKEYRCQREHQRLDGSTPTEIGEELGVSEDAARMLSGAALAKLRESMRPGHDPG